MAQAGAKMSPAEYIALMIAWSAMFSGERKTLELPEGYRPSL